MKRLSLALAALPVALTAVACGGSSSSSETSGGAPAASSTGAPAAGSTDGQATSSAVGRGAYGSASSSATAAATTASASTGAAIVSTKQTKLGPILSGQKGMTLYLWLADRGGRSVCTGACAHVWPPLLTTGTPQASGDAKGADLGTAKRADGTTQVTYNGQPLYYFAKDKDREDRYGQGSNAFGAPWYVVAADGQAIHGG